jgi:hypothetical protein
MLGLRAQRITFGCPAGDITGGIIINKPTPSIHTYLDHSYNL